MAVSFFPFDAGSGATVLESQWQKMARRWLGTGVIGGYLNQLSVTADGTTLGGSVASGGAWIEGFYYDSDAAIAFTVAAANATNPRIDSVVLRLDRTANTITQTVVTGTPAASPSAPTLNATDTLFDLLLANVTVPAAAGVLVAGNVSDQRRFAGPAAPATITASGAAVKPLVLKLAASPTANALEVQSNTGTVLVSVNASGSISTNADFVTSAAGSTQLGGGGFLGGTLNVTARTVNNQGIIVRGAIGQTASLAEFQNSSGTVLARFNATGSLIIRDDIEAGNVFRLGAASGAATTAHLNVWSTSGATVLVVRGAAGQISNLAEFQNSSGTVLTSVGADGSITATLSGGLTSFGNGNIGGLSASSAVRVQIRPGSGKHGYLTFTEDTVADRWAVGTKPGDSALYFLGFDNAVFTSRARLLDTGVMQRWNGTAWLSATYT